MERSRDSGAALIVTMVTITALLALGAITVTTMRAELGAAGQSRFTQQAVFAAESGASAAMELLRDHCSAQTLFSSWVEPNNASPQSPIAILGNGIRAGESGNVFDAVDANAESSYDIAILNNLSDSGLAAGDDTDGTVVLRVIGHGPNQTVAGIEVEVQNQVCLSRFCEQELAQKNGTARDDPSGGGPCVARAGKLVALDGASSPEGQNGPSTRVAPTGSSGSGSTSGNGSAADQTGKTVDAFSVLSWRQLF